MRNTRNIARLSSLTLALIGLMCGNTLPILSSDCIARAANNASHTEPTDRLVSKAVSNGKIAFTSDRDGNPEIYVMNADGTEQVRLTNNPGLDDFPTWSPDG